jgi:CRISPR system Cascade subunit CasE
MILSRLLLNPRSPQVQAELSNLYELHRTVMSGFTQGLRVLPEDDARRVLYRLEVRRQMPMLTLLVQSPITAVWQHLVESKYLLRTPEQREFSPGFQAGEVFAFRLVANPAKKQRVDGKKNGRRVALYDPEEQLTWLTRKAEQYGFRVQGVQARPPEDLQGFLFRGDARHTLKIVAVQYDGLLEVTDPTALSAAIRDGIGPAKGFGCGLLSLARAA